MNNNFNQNMNNNVNFNNLVQPPLVRYDVSTNSNNSDNSFSHPSKLVAYGSLLPWVTYNPDKYGQQVEYLNRINDNNNIYVENVNVINNDVVNNDADDLVDDNNNDNPHKKRKIY